MTDLIHPSAQIAETARIGEETRVQKDCVLHDHTRIGNQCHIEEGTEIGPWAFIGDSVRIGARVRIHPGTEIEDDVIIDDDCVLGQPEDISKTGTTRLHKTFIRKASHIHLSGIEAPEAEDRTETKAPPPYDQSR